MDVLAFVVLVATVIAGGALGMRYPQLQGRSLHLVLSFSGAYLMCITALHVLPEAFADPEHQVGLALLIGFFAQVLFEQLSAGVEHGHLHVHPGQRLALPVLTGLSLHALLEGAPLSLIDDALHVGHGHDHLLAGIAMHKLPAAFALSVLLSVAGYTKRTIWILLSGFALMSPLGAIIAQALLPPTWMPYLLAAVAGSLLHVGTTILFEADGSDRHQLTWAKTVAIGLGLIAGLTTAYI